jgi:6-phosphogluconate dehydrogenase
MSTEDGLARSPADRAVADIGVTGLALMDRNLARHGQTVAVHNRTYARTRSLVDDHGHEGVFVPAESLVEFAASLSRHVR